MATITGFNAHTPSLHIFNVTHAMLSSPTSTISALAKKHPLNHSPKLSNSQPAHFREKTWSSGKYSSKREGKIILCSINKLAETESIPLEENPRHLAEKLPSATGVYAMHDKNGELQFIGISRMVSNSVLSHIRDVPELCGSVKIALVDAPDRAALTDAWKLWMEEHIAVNGKVPPGNESGNNTWVKKQRQAKPDLRLTPGQHMQLTVPLEQLIDKLVKENEVVVFIKGSRTAPQCGFSHKVLTILNEQGVDYESVNVFDEEYNPGLRETMKVYSGWPTFPQVFVRGELIGGADILSEMAEKGELQDLFRVKK
ncbi:hypothetical protein SUGI_0785600 [Cryptomeria japonica]|uniref:bifunctional monothiol glutaredoxin-S16, chloroplastic isoform X2 n=1 Tax=Cryptomeria japonica TaxID=3369 RepID=UPI002414CF15|nr:bifunctional monothiol glutaredoxin-S16, chloroplastic isoform X2 [Cryptomeria japonica]GLJ38544.1 hypothetical protein SUGI_0785600 [Cryptomeria japonica]